MHSRSSLSQGAEAPQGKRLQGAEAPQGKRLQGAEAPKVKDYKGLKPLVAEGKEIKSITSLQ